MGGFEPELPDDDGYRVLHVEDDDAFRRLAREMFRQRTDDVEVSSAPSGPAALERIDDEQFDCVISDYDMPEMDGLDLLRAVREDHEHVPFVLFTGKGSEEIASEAISEGVTDYVRKTGSSDRFDVLAQRVRNAVESYRRRRDLERLKRRYEHVARSTADAIFEWHVQGDDVSEDDTVYRNVGYSRSFGYEKAAVDDELGWWIERVHPEDREEAVEALEAVIDRGDHRYEDSYRFRREDGTYVEVDSRGYVEYDEDGPDVMVGAIIVTE